MGVETLVRCPARVPCTHPSTPLRQDPGARGFRTGYRYAPRSSDEIAFGDGIRAAVVQWFGGIHAGGLDLRTWAQRIRSLPHRRRRVSTPRRRAFDRLSSPPCSRAAQRTDPGRRLLARPDDEDSVVARLMGRAEGAGALQSGPRADVLLRVPGEVKRMRTPRLGDPAPLLIRLVRRPFALRTVRSFRRSIREPRPGMERLRLEPSSVLSASLTEALRAAFDVRHRTRPLPASGRPRVRRRPEPPAITLFDAPPEEVLP